MITDEQKGEAIKIDEARIKDHLGEMVRGTVEEALNAMLDPEADQLCGAGKANQPLYKIFISAHYFSKTHN